MTIEADDALLNAYLDGELDAAGVVEVERLLADSAECRAKLGRLTAVRDALRSPGVAHRAPSTLAARIDEATVPQSPARLRPGARPPSWLVGTIGGALAASLAFMVALPRATKPDPTNMLVENHVRSLLADHLVDVRTSDRHTVKPWFNGRVALAPPVPELADVGFPLFGGRLDVIDGHVVPAIVYRRRLHTINLFVLPGTGTAAVRSVRLDGYSVVEWSQGGLQFAAVSDIDMAELAEFERDYATRSPK